MTGDRGSAYYNKEPAIYEGILETPTKVITLDNYIKKELARKRKKGYNVNCYRIRNDDKEKLNDRGVIWSR